MSRRAGNGLPTSRLPAILPATWMVAAAVTLSIGLAVATAVPASAGGTRAAAARANSRGVGAGIVAVASTPDGLGLYLVDAQGTVSVRGNAVFHGDMTGRRLNAPIVGIAVDESTGGYWLVAKDGGVFAFDAKYRGSMAGRHLNAPIVAMTGSSAYPDGYWLVAADGGVFSFGAYFSGSMSGQHLNAPIVATAYDPVLGVYWLLGSDGGVFFGPYDGSAASDHPATPVVGMAAVTPADYHETGYRIATAGGAVYCFGVAACDGALAGPLTSPVIGIANYGSGNGYWLVQADGAVTGFGGAPAFAAPTAS
jgi:hypothetical protein